MDDDNNLNGEEFKEVEEEVEVFEEEDTEEEAEPLAEEEAEPFEEEEVDPNEGDLNVKNINEVEPFNNVGEQEIEDEEDDFDDGFEDVDPLELEALEEILGNNQSDVESIGAPPSVSSRADSSGPSLLEWLLTHERDQWAQKEAEKNTQIDHLERERDWYRQEHDKLWHQKQAYELDRIVHAMDLNAANKEIQELKERELKDAEEIKRMAWMLEQAFRNAKDWEETANRRGDEAKRFEAYNIRLKEEKRARREAMEELRRRLNAKEKPESSKAGEKRRRKK